MISTTQAKARILQLIAQDNSTDNQTNQYYNECMAYIASHLYAFYQEYAQENNLSLQQTKANVNRWDLKQWKAAINQLDTSDWPQEAKDRINVYGSAAGIDKRHMMANIAKAGLLAFAVKVLHMINKRVTGDAMDQVKFMQRTMDLTPKQTEKNITYVTEQSRQDIWSANLWSDTDKLANDVENLVNQHLRHGMSLHDLHSILSTHANPQQFKPNQSIASRIKQMEFNARRIVRNESSHMVNQINLSTYRQVGVTVVDWVTEPGHCDLCGSLEDGSPYQLESAPIPPDDSHIQCRCTIVPIGTQYQRYVTYNRIF